MEVRIEPTELSSAHTQHRLVSGRRGGGRIDHEGDHRLKPVRRTNRQFAIGQAVQRDLGRPDPLGAVEPQFHDANPRQFADPTERFFERRDVRHGFVPLAIRREGHDQYPGVTRGGLRGIRCRLDATVERFTGARFPIPGSGRRGAVGGCIGFPNQLVRFARR